MADFKKYYLINALPEEVYAALTFEPTLTLWTGAPAVFIKEVGQEFSLWDGSIVGKNLAFEEGHMIQQEWYFGEQENASIVTIKLHPHKKGTSLQLEHTNIPADAYDEILDGWNHVYMRDLTDFYLD